MQRHVDGAPGPRVTYVDGERGPVVGRLESADGELLIERRRDPRKRLLVVRGPRGAEAFELDDDDRPVLHRSVEGHETRWRHEADRVSRTAPDGTTVTVHLDEWGAPVRWTSGDDDVRVERDARGRPLRRATSTGDDARLCWSADGLLLALGDGRRAAETYDRDPDGRLTTVRGEGTTRVRRDEAGVPQEVLGGAGGRSANRDELGRVREVAAAEAHTTLRYDGAGTLAEVRRPTGDRLLYDRRDGHLVRLRDGVVDVHLDRDRAGRVARVRAGETDLAIHRDPDGRVAWVELPGGGLDERVHDGAGRLREARGAGGVEVRVDRDEVGRVRGIARNGVPTIALERDHRGHRRARHEGEASARYRVRPDGWLEAAETDDGALALHRDAAGRIVEERSGDDTLRVARDDAGRRREVEGGGLRWTLERDGIGRTVRATLALSGGSAREWRLRRDGPGRVLRAELPGGAELSVERDAVGRPIRQTVTRAGRELATDRYAWAGLGWRVGDRLHDSPERALLHDRRGALVRTSAGSRQVVRDVDPLGAPRSGGVEVGADGRIAAAGAVRFIHDRAGRRIEARGEDGAVTRYAWGPDDTLAEIVLPDGRTVRYRYDPLGRLTSRQMSGEPPWRFTWDGAHLFALDRGDRRTAWLRIDGELVAVVQDGRVCSALTDPVGHVRGLLGEDGTLVWSGDGELVGAGDGHWTDPATGLQHALLRVHDPRTASYLTPNPLGLGAGPSLYRPLADPLSHRGPYGLLGGVDPVWGAAIPGGPEADDARWRLRQLGGALRTARLTDPPPDLGERLLGVPRPTLSSLGPCGGHPDLGAATLRSPCRAIGCTSRVRSA